MTSYDETEEGKSNKMLNAWELYKQEVLDPAITDDDARVWAAQAREGDARAKELLATYCVRFAIWQAAKYTQFVYSYDEYMELIAAGNEKIALSLDAALTKRDAVPYIRAAIKYGVVDASRYYKRFVTISLDELSESLAVEVVLPSPDTQAEHPKASAIRDALATLTEKQREIVIRHFGLDGHAPEPLSDLNKRLSPTNADIAGDRLRRALRKLRDALEA